MGKTLPVVVQNIGAIPQQLMRPQQQLSKIHRAGALARLLIGAVDSYHLALVVVIPIIQMLCPAPLILLAIDKPLYLTWRPLGVIQIHLTDDAFDQPVLVIRIQDLKCLGQTSLLPVGPQ